MTVPERDYLDYVNEVAQSVNAMHREERHLQEAANGD